MVVLKGGYFSGSDLVTRALKSGGLSLSRDRKRSWRDLGLLPGWGGGELNKKMQTAQEQRLAITG